MSSRSKRKSVADQYEMGETGSESKRGSIQDNTTIYSIPLPAGGGTTPSNVIQPIAQEANAYRSISVKNLSLPPNDQKNEVEDFLKSPYSFKCPKSDGTPQKRLLYLAKACLEIINNKQYTYKPPTKPEIAQYSQLIQFMEGQKEDETAERNWWSGASDNKDYLNNLIVKVLNKPPKLDDTTYDSIIISLQLIILGKSYSDISQMGQLINYIRNLITSGGTSMGSIFNIINNDAKVAFISSDKICAGVSSLIIDKLPFLFETLCTRKSSQGHKNVQNIIVQKGVIATLSVILGLIETSTDLNEIKSIFQDDNMILKLLTIYKKYLISLKGVTTIDMEYNNLYDLRKKIEKDENAFLIYESNSKLINLSTFINEIKEVISSDENLSNLMKCRDVLFNDKKIHTSPKWTYYVANDVFRLLAPQNVTEFDKLKTDISIYEFLCATIDGTYGHDFHGLDCVQYLGEFFWNIAGFPDDLKIQNGPKNENEAIKKCLKYSNCVTIDQHEDELVYNFNNEDNFLISDTNLGNPKNWHFFDSLFSVKPLILSVDFTKGIQTELVSGMSAAISIKQQKVEEKSKELINPLQPNELQDEVLSLFEQSGIGKELNGATTIFDGAAPYGLFPLYITDDEGNIETYTSEIIIERGNTRFQLEISTHSNLTKNALEKKYINSIIQSRESPTPQIFDILVKDPFYIRDDYLSFIKKFQETSKAQRFIELYAKLLNSRINNGKLKLGKKELFSFIKGCKIFIANIKKKGAIPPILNNIDDLTKEVISSATADILKYVFNEILANIIYILYYFQQSEDDENILLDLFEYGVYFEYVEGETIYGLSKKEKTTKSIQVGSLASDNDILELFNDVRKSQLLKPRHYLKGKTPILPTGVSPIPSTQGLQKGITVESKSYNPTKGDIGRGWLAGFGAGTLKSLQNNPSTTQINSALNTPITERTKVEIRTPDTTTETTKGLDYLYHNTPGSTQELIETQIDTPMDEGEQKEPNESNWQQLYSSPAKRGDNFYPNTPNTSLQQSQEQATYTSPSSSQKQRGGKSGGKKSKRQTKRQTKNKNKRTKRLLK